MSSVLDPLGVLHLDVQDLLATKRVGVAKDIIFITRLKFIASMHA